MSTPDRFQLSVNDYITYRRDGYIIIRNLVSQEEVDELRLHTEGLMSGSVTIDGVEPPPENATEEEKANAYTLKGGYTIPLVAFALCLWIGSNATLDAWLVTGALLAFGIVLYLVAQWQIRATRPQSPPAL